MMGTMFCQYETPCGWCVRLDKECPERVKPKLKKRGYITENPNADREIVNFLKKIENGEYTGPEDISVR